LTRLTDKQAERLEIEKYEQAKRDLLFRAGEIQAGKTDEELLAVAKSVADLMHRSEIMWPLIAVACSERGLDPYQYLA
jgi:hypothetical protein